MVETVVEKVVLSVKVVSVVAATGRRGLCAVRRDIWMTALCSFPLHHFVHSALYIQQYSKSSSSLENPIVTYV